MDGRIKSEAGRGKKIQCLFVNECWQLKALALGINSLAQQMGLLPPQAFLISSTDCAQQVKHVCGCASLGTVSHWEHGDGQTGTSNANRMGVLFFNVASCLIHYYFLFLIKPSNLSLAACIRVGFQIEHDSPPAFLMLQDWNICKVIE